MSFISKTRVPRRAIGAKLATVAATLLFATACSDDGPSYPDVFDPAAIQTELALAGAAMETPATESFAAAGILIDDALAAMGGAELSLSTPAMLLDGGALTPSEARDVATSLRRVATLRTATPGGTVANAIPNAALGRTFEYDPATDQYVMGDIDGAPDNGVRFVLYLIDPTFGMPVEPLVEAGYVDLTRTATNNSAQGRIEVYNGALSQLKVLDYTARVEGSVSSPRIVIAGFARNANDRLDFSLATSFSLEDESIDVEWRTTLPEHDLVTRLNQSFTSGEEPRFVIDAAVVSANGRIDMDGSILEFGGGSIVVKVNGQTFATMDLATGEDEQPTITNADGEPLTAEEEATLQQIFEWFAGAFIVFIVLLAPLGSVLDAAF